MIALSLALVALAQDGNRLRDPLAETALSLEHRAAIGREAGTDMSTLKATYAHDDAWVFSLALPYASFRIPGDMPRETALGNLLFEGWRIMERGDDGAYRALGVEAHWNLGSRAWTWVNDADELWPGTGVDAVWQERGAGDLAWTWRALVGLHGARSFEPYPGFWLRAGGAAGIDYAIHPLVSVLAEGSLTYWDTSPIEVAAILHSEPLDGLKLRAGWVWPLGVWMGASPGNGAAGFHESTLLFEVRLTQ